MPSVLMRRMITCLALLLMFTAVVIALPGCNTVEGIGRDVESAGEGIADLADGDA